MAWVKLLLCLSCLAVVNCISLEDIELPRSLADKQSPLDESSVLLLKELIQKAGVIPAEVCKAAGFLCGVTNVETSSPNVYVEEPSRRPLRKSLISEPITTPNPFFRLNALEAGSRVVVPPLHNANDFPNKLLHPSLEEAMKKVDVARLLEAFSIPTASPLAKSVQESEDDCSKKSTGTETKICVASIQSIQRAVTSIMSPQISACKDRAEEAACVLKFITSSPRTSYEHLKVVGSVEVTDKTIATCHPVAFPYSVYMCHTIPNTKLFKIVLERRAEIVEIPAICHMETSSFDDADVALKALGMKPGDGEVCHWLSNSSVTWYM